MTTRSVPRKERKTSAPVARPSEPAPARTELTSRVRYGALALIALLSFLPIGFWLGVDVGAPSVTAVAPTWLLGTGATVIVALLVSIMAGGASARAWLERAHVLVDRHWLLLCVALCLFSLLLNAWVASAIFGRFPLHIDELTQGIQAGIFASGRLWQRTPLDPEFTSALLMVDVDGRRFAQFPPGWSLLLALGELVRARWLAGPLVGALATLGMFALFRALDQTRPFALAGAVLFALSPWLVFNAGSQMNHTATLMWLLFASAALLTALREARHRHLFLAIAGLCLGAAAATRPLDALAFAVPAGVWLTFRAWHARSIRELFSFGLGLMLPMSLLLAYNAATTGHPLVFGYEAQWGAIHGPGFHEAPWGPAHTPARGIALLNKYLLRLQSVLFESPAPALLAPLAALALARKLADADRYLLGAASLLGIGYALYWHDGEYLGPRFLLACAPLIILWTARLPAAIAERTVYPFAPRWAVAWIVLVVLAGWFTLPRTAREYAASSPPRRIDADALARAHDVHKAVIFVPSPWSAQLTPRLWALGISRHDAQILSDRIEPCTLETALAQLEPSTLRGAQARARLQSLATARDNGRDQVAGVQRIQDRPTTEISGLCRRRVQAERAGTWSLLPFLLARREQNVFVRDMQERNELLFRRFTGPFYIVRPDSLYGLDRPRLMRLDADSARWDWAINRR